MRGPKHLLKIEKYNIFKKHKSSRITNYVLGRINYVLGIYKGEKREENDYIIRRKKFLWVQIS